MSNGGDGGTCTSSHGVNNLDYLQLEPDKALDEQWIHVGVQAPYQTRRVIPNVIPELLISE